MNPAFDRLSLSIPGYVWGPIGLFVAILVLVSFSGFAHFKIVTTQSHADLLEGLGSDGYVTSNSLPETRVPGHTGSIAADAPAMAAVSGAVPPAVAR